MSTTFMVSSLLGAMVALCTGAAITVVAMVESDSCIAFLEECIQQPVVRRRQTKTDPSQLD